MYLFYSLRYYKSAYFEKSSMLTNNKSEVKESSTLSLVGVTLTKNITCLAHGSNLAKAVSQILNLLFRSMCSLTPEDLLNIDRSQWRPTIEYFLTYGDLLLSQQSSTSLAPSRRPSSCSIVISVVFVPKKCPIFSRR